MNIPLLLQQHHLHAGVRRKMSFFMMLTVAQGYTKHLRPWMDFSYEVCGVITDAGQIISIVNDERIAQKVEEFLHKNPTKLKEEIFPMTKEFLAQQTGTPQSIQSKDPRTTLKNLVAFYPFYFGVIGIYNSLNRYVTERPQQKILDEETLFTIGYYRNELGSIYPLLDALFLETIQQLPSGKLLAYLSFYEMQHYLQNGTLPSNLAQRPEGCVALYVEEQDKEIFSTDSKIVEEARKILLPTIDQNIQIIKGLPIHPGTVQGIVIHLPRPHDQPLPPNAIIITSMTTVHDTHFIAAAKAVVADEGGILCHAAVIARELKKPCIVGTKVGSKIFKEGQQVEVNAEKGIIKKIKKDF